MWVFSLKFLSIVVGALVSWYLAMKQELFEVKLGHTFKWHVLDGTKKQESEGVHNLQVYLGGIHKVRTPYFRPF